MRDGPLPHRRFVIYVLTFFSALLVMGLNRKIAMQGAAGPGGSTTYFSGAAARAGAAHPGGRLALAIGSGTAQRRRRAGDVQAEGESSALVGVAAAVVLENEDGVPTLGEGELQVAPTVLGC